MDTNMEDVGRVPADLAPLPPAEPTTIPTLDGWIENLMNCKQLAEGDVQRLCAKVGVNSLLFAPCSYRIPGAELFYAPKTQMPASRIPPTIWILCLVVA